MSASFDQAQDSGALRRPAAALEEAETTENAQRATSSAAVTPGGRATRNLSRATLRATSDRCECLCSKELLSVVGLLQRPSAAIGTRLSWRERVAVMWSTVGTPPAAHIGRRSQPPLVRTWRSTPCVATFV